MCLPPPLPHDTNPFIHHPLIRFVSCHPSTERSQHAPIYASDLQSVSWGAHALGGIMGCTTVGQAQANLHSRGVFGLTAITPFVIMVLAALRWLPEKQVPLAERRGSCRRGFQGGQRSLYFLAIFVAACAVLLATTVSHVKDKLIGGCITLSVAVAVATAVYVVRACAGATGWAHLQAEHARLIHPTTTTPHSTPPVIRRWRASPPRSRGPPSSSSSARRCSPTSGRPCSSGTPPRRPCPTSRPSSWCVRGVS